LVSISENYLSDLQLLNKKLGVQVEVVFGSPQARATLERCLWMAEDEQQLQREPNESSLPFPQSIRCPFSASPVQHFKHSSKIN